MSTKHTPEPIEITFHDAYEELKAVTEKLNGEDIEADQLVGLLRKGKGLEVVLRQHLTEIEQQVESIEKNEDIAIYKIVPGEAAEFEPSSDVPADTSDFEGAEVESTGARGSDDEIPF
jgi:exonuclease VII small subunit